MTVKATSWLSLGLLAGILSGGWLGVLFPGVMTVLSFVGEGFLGTFTILSFFVVTTGLISAIIGLGDASKVKLTILKNLGFYGVTTILAGVIGFGVAFIFKPSKSIATGALTGDPMASLMGNGWWIGSVLFAAILGLALVSLKIRGRSLGTLIKNLNEGMSEVTSKLFYLAPIGLFSLAGTYVAREGLDFSLVGSGASQFVLAVVCGLAVYLLVVLPLSLKLFSGKSILSFYLNLLPAALIALGTLSSRLALPFVAQAVIDKNRCDPRSTGLAVSLGSIFNVGPTLLVVMAATLFISQGPGVAVSISTILIVALVTIFMSIGLASTAGAVVPILAIAFGLAGAPVAMVAGIAAISLVAWLVEPLRALANSMGDATGAAILSESFEFKTALRTPTRTDPRRDRFSRERTSSSSRSGGSSRRPNSSTSSDRSKGGRSSTASGSERAPRRSSSTTTSDHPARGRAGAERKASASRQAPATVTRRNDNKKADSEKSPFDIVAPGTPALELGQGPEKSPATTRTKQTRTRRDSSSTSEGRGRGRADRRETTPKDSVRKETTTRESSPVETASQESAAADSSQRESSPRDSSRRVSSRRESSRRRPTSSRTRDHAKPAKTAEPVEAVVNADSQVDNNSAVSTTRARIEEDLARVSEQLKQMDIRAEVDPIAEAPKVDEPTVDTPVVEQRVETPRVETPREEPAIENSPVQAETTDAAETASPEIDSPEPAVETKRNGISDAEKEVAASFGRGSRRTRTKAKPESSAKSDETPVEVETKQEPKSETVETPPVAVVAEANVETASAKESDSTVAPNESAKPVSFGRSKRKKKLR